MGQVCRIGLDIAKQYIQAHGMERNGKDIFNRKLKRTDVLLFFVNLPPCLIDIEGCGDAHYWVRQLGKPDTVHTVRLIAQRHVKAVRHQQQDRCRRCQSHLQSS